MLETFGWTDGVVMDTPEYAVIALESPTLDAFARCPTGTIYGVVVDGQNAILHRRRHGCALPAETVFATSSPEHGLSSPGGRLLLVVAKGKDTPFVLTEVEATGRLRYIDGCTDSLLIPPVRKGEPCLNFLHIPPNVEQTMHTHPSDRVGVVLDGRGQCVTPPNGKTWRTWFDDLVALWPVEYQRIIQTNVVAIINMHNRKTRNREIPNDNADPVSGLSWKFLCMVASRGDLKGRKRGMMNDRALKECVRRGITYEQAKAEIDNGHL